MGRSWTTKGAAPRGMGFVILDGLSPVVHRSCLLWEKYPNHEENTRCSKV